MAVKYRRISRYSEIMGVLFKHGFRYLMEKAGFSKKTCSAPERIKMIFEDLGPTYVKLGQLLSSRPDLVPRKYVEEFSELQDNVEEVSPKEIRRQFVRELNNTPENIFYHFDYEPLASASIGQVHRAVLNGGEEVVVKVQRPYLHKLVKGDIRILKRFSGILDKYTVVGQVCDVHEIIDVFERQIFRELDYLTEAVNTEAFYRELSDDERFIVPRVFTDYTTRRIMTMEYIRGKRVEYFTENETSEEDRRKYAENMLTGIFRPLFEEGVFHGDPHPGNVLFQDGFKIVLIDFGIIGRFDREHRKLIAELMIALTERDVPAVMRIILETGKATRKVNKQYFFEDVAEIVEKANGVTSGDISLAELIDGMITISLHHGIKVPDNMFILGKTVMLSESLARRICPEIDIMEVIRPMAVDYLRNSLHPGLYTSSLYRQMSDVPEALLSLPGNICQAVKNLAHNEMQITFYHRNLNWLEEKLDISSSRISFGLILASMIVGSAFIMYTGKGPLLWGYPAIGVLGFMFSGLLGFWVLVAMLRSGRL